MDGFCLALALVAHAAHGALKAGGGLGIEQVYVLCIAGHIVLLALLQHGGVDGGTQTGRYNHTHGDHGADPGRQELIGHALRGVGGDERIEHHHTGAAQDDGVLHAFVEPGGLHLEVHEQGGQTDEQEAAGKDVLEVDFLHAQEDGGQPADGVAQHGPVAQRGVLPVVQLHADAGKDVDEHGAGVEEHQQEVEDDAHADGAQLEHAYQVVGAAVGGFHIEEQGTAEHAGDGGHPDGGVVPPVEHLAVDHDVGEAQQGDAEQGGVAELTEVDGEPLVLESVVGHGDKYHQDAYQQHAHHVVVDVLPLVFIGQPRGERGAELSQDHEEEVDAGLGYGALYVEAVPGFFGVGLQAGLDLEVGFYVSGVEDEGKQVDHHQHHAQKAHQDAAQGQQEHVVGLGADVTQQVHQRESGQTHHLFTADHYQPVEEGAEGGHPDGGSEVGEGDVFGDDAQPAHLFGAIDGIDAAHRQDGDEEEHQYKDAQPLGHPVIEWIVSWV